MNRRHQTILFLTMVMTGCSLLAGATLPEGLGILILGTALAWLVGSQTATRTYTFLTKLPGKLWPWFRALLLMALAGSLFVGVLVWSNYSPFLVTVAMSIFAMFFAPLFYLPTDRSWLRVVGGVAATGVFFFTAVAVMLLGGQGEHAERLGELAVPGLIAIPIGTSWLARGWGLLLKGISSDEPTSTSELTNTEIGKSTAWLYVSLIAGTIVLTFWLGLLMFSAFSQSLFHTQSTVAKQNPLTPVVSLLLVILLAWWPFSCWKKILRREPNTVPTNVRRHKFVTGALGILFAIILCFAVTFGVQNGIDRETEARVREGTDRFKDVAAKIGAIKSRDLKTADDYIQAYAEIDSLRSEYDGKLQQVTDILSEVRRRDKTRGPINVRPLLFPRDAEWLDWDDQIFNLLHQDNELTKKEVLVSKQMASVPQEYQVDFWNKNFRPLLEEEDSVRKKINALQKTKPH